MKESGLKGIYVGVETGSPKIMKKLKKRIKLDDVRRAAKLCKKYKISFSVFFMIGFPWETEQDIRMTIDLVKELAADRTNVCTVTPYPKTELYEEFLKMGLITFDTDLSQFSHHSATNYFTPLMPQETYLKLLDELNREADLLNHRFSIGFAYRWFKRMRSEILRHPFKFGRRITVFLREAAAMRLKIIKNHKIEQSQKSE